MKTLIKLIKGIFKSISIKNAFRLIWDMIKKNYVATMIGATLGALTWMYQIFPITAVLISLIPGLTISSDIKWIDMLLTVTLMILLFYISAVHPYILLVLSMVGGIIAAYDVALYEESIRNPNVNTNMG